MADLGQWLAGAYRVPGEEPPQEPEPGEKDEAS
jgi:endogenous inhibitor of DNA gyrase (YacG/DUF329 family)